MPRITRAELEAHERQKSRPVGRAARRTAVTPKEREIQKAILAFLKTVPGVVAWRNNTGAVSTGHRFVRFGMRGGADIIGWWQRLAACGAAACCPDRQPCTPTRVAIFLAIEVKTAKTYPTVEQQAFLDQVKAAGGIAICARSVYDVAKALGLEHRGWP